MPDSARLNETRSEEHTSELQSQSNLVCRLLLEKKKKKIHSYNHHLNPPTPPSHYNTHLHKQKPHHHTTPAHLPTRPSHPKRSILGDYYIPQTTPRTAVP